MHRTRMGRFARLLASALVCLAFAGCEITVLTIQIADFDEVEGLWLWRLSDTSGSYERSGQIQLSQVDGSQGGVVAYRETCANGTVGISNQASVSRPDGDPTTATLALPYLSCEGPGGTYRASAYNQAGESALSATTVTF